MKFKNRGSIYAFSLGMGVLASALTALIISVLMAVAVSSLSLSPKLMPLLMTLTIALMGISGGYITSRILGKKGLLMGAFLGVIVAIILTMLSGLFTEFSPSAGGFVKLVVIIVSAMAGGVLGVNAKQKR